MIKTEKGETTISGISAELLADVACVVSSVSEELMESMSTEECFELMTTAISAGMGNGVKKYEKSKKNL